MNSLSQFIIEPIGDRYDNKIKVDNKELIINSSISDHKFINRTARVISIPLEFETNIKPGYKIIYAQSAIQQQVIWVNIAVWMRPNCGP